MKKYLLILILLSLSDAKAQEIWTIGPMLQFHLGADKRSTSFAIEAAYWNIDGVPYSVDFAIEFDRKKTRIYSEVQTGIGLVGLSAGPVIEFKRGSVKVGKQFTLWGNYLLGFDYRYRKIDKERFHALGTYFKVPMARSGFEENNSNSSWGIDWDD